MNKIYATQLQGIFQKILKEEDQHLEDAARCLAQAVTAEGEIMVYATRIMKPVLTELLTSRDTYPGIIELSDTGDIGPRDRVLIISEDDHDKEALDIVDACKSLDVPTVAISNSAKGDPGPLLTEADIHINLNVRGPVVPITDDKKVGTPYIMAAFFCSHMIYYTFLEILEEQKEEDL